MFLASKSEFLLKFRIACLEPVFGNLFCCILCLPVLVHGEDGSCEGHKQEAEDHLNDDQNFSDV